MRLGLSSFKFSYFSRMRSVFLCIVGIFLFSCSPKSNTSLSLDGDWQFAEETAVAEGQQHWNFAQVPGTVQTDLLRLNKIPDPFIWSNEDSVQWVSDKVWMYKKEFQVPSEQLKHLRHILHFEGLDTYTQVFLNDSLILETDNAFRPWEVDVSTLLKGENIVKVKLFPVEPKEVKAATLLDYELPEAPRVFTRKPQFQYGWDWGPTIKTMGIWRDVKLASFSEARMTDVFLQTETIEDDVAQLLAKIELEILHEDDITVEVTNETTRVRTSKKLNVNAGKQVVEIPLKIENPKLWWTHNLGDPFLYDYTIVLKKGNTVIDRQTKRVGLRTIQLVTEKDNKGEGFYFELNGKPVYMKGANYIPQHIFLPEVTREDREQLLEDAVTANMNMLRVWGGGVYEEDAFYELCDEKGILLWQDFMFACAMYPGDQAFLDNVKQEAIDNVKRLRQHPSIALWCGNNENSEGWHRWGWQAGKTEAQKVEIWRNYQKVFNDILPKVVDSLQPSISYWESSPKYGRGDQRYQYEGDAHDWWVWHDGYPFEHFEDEVPRFMSEFGFQSFPSYEAIQHFTQEDTISITHPSFATHQKHSRGFQLIREYMERDYPVPDRDEDYVYMSQLVQARGIAKGIHAHRRAKPYNMGTLYWQLNDCWPVVSWSSIDGLGNWKALHYAAKRAFEEILISTINREDNIDIYIVNDTFTPLKEQLTIEVFDFNGTLLKSFTAVPIVDSNTSKKVYTLSRKDIPMNPHLGFLKVKYGQREVVHYLQKPKDLQLPNQGITHTITKTATGFEISLTTKALQKDVFIIPSVSGKLSDNFFDLLPDTVKTIQFTTDATEMGIRFKTLNSVRAD